MTEAAFRPPHSPVLFRDVTREYARRLRREGLAPAGCIWIPGAIPNHPHVGNLHGPDPDWQSPRPV